jgi:hypothetical protein
LPLLSQSQSTPLSAAERDEDSFLSQGESTFRRAC